MKEAELYSFEKAQAEAEELKKIKEIRADISYAEAEKIYERESTLEVTPEFLEKFFTSKEFQNKIKECSKKIEQFRREFGFAVLGNLGSGKTRFTKPIGGEFDYQTNLEVAKDEVWKKLDDLIGNFYELVHVHFHNTRAVQDEIIIPSKSDLFMEDEAGQITDKSIESATDKKTLVSYMMKTINMIGMRGSSERVKFLVYQNNMRYNFEKQSSIRQELLHTLDELHIENAPQENIVQTLRHYGFKAEMVESKDGVFDKENLQKLKQFAFKPVREKE